MNNVIRYLSGALILFFSACIAYLLFKNVYFIKNIIRFAPSAGDYLLFAVVVTRNLLSGFALAIYIFFTKNRYILVAAIVFGAFFVLIDVEHAAKFIGGHVFLIHAMDGMVKWFVVANVVFTIMGAMLLFDRSENSKKE